MKKFGQKILTPRNIKIVAKTFVEKVKSKRFLWECFSQETDLFVRRMIVRLFRLADFWNRIEIGKI